MWGLLLNRYVLGVALVGFLLLGAYTKGRADCSAKYEYAALEAERNSLRQMMQAEKVARAADAQRLAENEALLRDLQEKAEDDAQKLKDGDSVCFSPDDNDSLRQHFRTAR